MNLLEDKIKWAWTADVSDCVERLILLALASNANTEMKSLCNLEDLSSSLLVPDYIIEESLFTLRKKGLIEKLTTSEYLLKNN